MSSTRLAALVAVLLLAGPAATVGAAPRMPIGFFDDPSFRWAPDRAQNLAAAAAAGATVIHTTANWAILAPRRPRNPTNANDRAYSLGDLDELVRESARYGLRVMVDVTGTPAWANGGRSQNHMPTRLADFGAFVRMLAKRYDGRNPGKGEVSLWSVWNEPNLQQFLTPQYVGKRIVSPANYARLYKVAYAAIKSENPLAKVAIGETSAQGRDRPIAGASQTVSPGTFARLLSKVHGLRFDAWAHHPYPTARTAPPLERVRYPNVTLAQLPRFERSLTAEFRRSVPIWITEYGHETRPAQPGGVSLGLQAEYARQALTYAENDPSVQLFCWFTFRDNQGNPWKSGLEQQSGAPKPAFTTFESIAHRVDGTTIYAKAGHPVGPVAVFVPYLTFYDPFGSTLGVTYRVTDRGNLVNAGEPQAALAPDGSVSFTPSFSPVRGHVYTVVATINDVHGNLQTRMASIVAT